MMTNKTFFEAIINRAEITDEMIEKATHLLEVEGRKSSKRDGEKTALATANFEVAKTIAEIMELDKIYTVSEINPNFPDMSPSKISAIMGVGVEGGLFEKIDGYKVGGKGRAVKGYKRIQ